MSARNAINLDDFDEEEPFPISVTINPIDVKDQGMLDAILKTKENESKRRNRRKVVLGILATIITLALIFT